MNMEKQIIAARVSGDRLLAVRTLEEPILSSEQLIFKIKMGGSYYAIINGVRKNFVLNEIGDDFTSPNPKELALIAQF